MPKQIAKIEKPEWEQGELPGMPSQEPSLTEPVTEPVTEAIMPVIYFTPESWAGVKTVLKCCTCGTFRDDEDGMILHVLTHFSESKQETILEELLANKASRKE